MLRNVIESLAQGAVLSQEDAHKTMEAIMGGEATAAQIGGILIALRLRERLPLRSQALPEPCARLQNPLYLQRGTGRHLRHRGRWRRDLQHLYHSRFCGGSLCLPVANTATAPLQAKCGSADLLAALGVEIDLNPHQVAWCIEEAGMGFLFAPTFHRAMPPCCRPQGESLGSGRCSTCGDSLTNPAAPTFKPLGVGREIGADCGRGAAEFRG